MLTELLRITSFRLTLLYGGLFALAVVGLLGFVYTQAAGYQYQQVDQILLSEAHAFSSAPRDQLVDDIAHEIARDFRHINLYGLFAADGGVLAGNLDHPPPELPVDGQPHAVPTLVNPGLSSADREVRALAQPLKDGEILIVARDVALLKQIRLALLRGLHGRSVLSGATL